jgi:hypothetical protein
MKEREKERKKERKKDRGERAKEREYAMTTEIEFASAPR